jgi:protein transport protein SEC24
MNPYQKKLFEKKYGATTEGGAQPPLDDSSQQTTQETNQPKPIFKNTADQNTTPINQTYTQNTSYTTQPKANTEHLEKYNSSKLAIRFSTETFPMTKKLTKMTNVPLSCSVHPFPSVYPHDQFPTAHFGANNSIVRCEHCRGYINPFC